MNENEKGKKCQLTKVGKIVGLAVGLAVVVVITDPKGQPYFNDFATILKEQSRERREVALMMMTIIIKILVQSFSRKIFY